MEKRKYYRKELLGTFEILRQSKVSLNCVYDYFWDKVAEYFTHK